MTTIINKSWLKNYKSLSIGLENCDSYSIDIDDVLDLYCETIQNKEDKNTYHANNGFIKLSANALQASEHFYMLYDRIDSKCSSRLKERLEMCGSAADMVYFSLDNNEKHTDIYVPYDTLEDVLHHIEIEFSNCPSWHIDNENNLVIEFGTSSRQPCRKDNNYAQLIEGWKDMFGDNAPAILEGKVFSIISLSHTSKNYQIYFEICNKHFKRKNITLMFLNCTDINSEMFFPNNGHTSIVMSKMADNRIYVGFAELGLDFICDCVCENNYHLNKR